MSLLLDALKRAEEAKRAKQSIELKEPAPGDATPDQPIELAEEASGIAHAKALEEMLAPPPAQTSSVRPTSRISRQPLALSLEEIAPQEAAHVERENVPPPANLPPAAATAKQDRGSPDAARTVFAAKQRPGVMAAAASKPWLLPALAVLVVSLGAGAWYVWQELSKLTRPAASVAARGNPPLASVPLAPMPTTTGQAALPKPAVPPAAEPVPEIVLPPLLPPALKDATGNPATGLAGPSEAALTPREAFAKKLKETPLAAEAPVTLKLSQSFQPAPVNPELARAYEALSNGDLDQARGLYARRVQADPLSLDAQLGLATVAARSGDRPLANRHYRDALAIDPRNEIAIAGLLAIAGEGSQASLETQLRTLLSQNPAAASLQFSLGNLLASQNRWVEAQQAYFEAYRLNGDVADHAFNLAVSLDHLGQSRLAREYYQKSLALQVRTRGQFDSAAVAKRVQELAGSDKAP